MISRQEALEIAFNACVGVSKEDLRHSAFKCIDLIPEGCRIYNMPTEPCWYINAPWGDGLDGKMLRSSRAILVSKESGRVLYDGSAYDEG